MMILAITAVVIFAILTMLDPIPQDTNYHNFADSRMFYNLPNFWNVISNLPFLIVGAYALNKMFRQKSMRYDKQMHIAYSLLFAGVSLVAFGSGYYHLDPNNDTLIWDRLPMTIAFMALFAIIIAEYISLKKGQILLYPLLVLGITSVAYWAYTESIGQGDLRLYAFVQFFPMLVIPVLLLKFPPTFTLRRGYWYLLLCYLLAKVFEHYDEAIYDILGFMSGHSLKHIVAALGMYVLVETLTRRERYSTRKIA